MHQAAQEPFAGIRPSPLTQRSCEMNERDLGTYTLAAPLFVLVRILKMSLYKAMSHLEVLTGPCHPIPYVRK